MTTTLADCIAELRQPFTVAAIRFKPLTKDFNGKSAAAFYIDARLVAERLNYAVGAGNWSDSYRLIAEGRETPALYYPIECSLTVLGVTKCDIGQGANTVLDDKAWKSAYSDALKRAAVKFGIGAYLYTLGQHWAQVEVGQNGKVKGFTDEGKKSLRDLYKRWLASDLNTFGVALDHGDVEEEIVPSAPATAETRAPKVAATPAPVAATSSNFTPPPSVAKLATPKQQQEIKELLPKVAAATGDSLAQVRVDVRKLAGCSFADMSEAVATDLIPKLEGWIANSSPQESLGGGVK